MALQFDSETLPSERELLDGLWAAIVKLYGEVGASASGLSLISFDSEHKMAIVRVWLDALPMVRASFASATILAEKPVAVHVLSVSGTLKSLRSREKSF